MFMALLKRNINPQWSIPQRKEENKHFVLSGVFRSKSEIIPGQFKHWLDPISTWYWCRSKWIKNTLQSERDQIIRTTSGGGLKQELCFYEPMHRRVLWVTVEAHRRADTCPPISLQHRPICQVNQLFFFQPRGCVKIWKFETLTVLSTRRGPHHWRRQSSYH